MRFAMKAKARRYTVRQINLSAMQAGPAATLAICAAMEALKTAERAEKLVLVEAVRRERARRAFDIENVEAQRKARAARMEQRGREILKAAQEEATVAPSGWLEFVTQVNQGLNAWNAGDAQHSEFSEHLRARGEGIMASAYSDLGQSDQER